MMDLRPVSDPRVLIAGTSYLADTGRCELTKLWLRVVRSLNPGVDVLVVDSASPFDPGQFLDCEIFRFDDNVGHPSRGERDGAGRAYCKALEIALLRGYKYCALIETDLIFAHPIAPTIDKMDLSAVKVCSPMAAPYQFPETGLMFFALDYVEESDFIKRYDWEHSPKWPIVEWRFLHLVERHYWQLPIHGLRNDHNQANVANLPNMFPYKPPAFLTHCQDFALYYRMLDLNGVNLI